MRCGFWLLPIDQWLNVVFLLVFQAIFAPLSPFCEKAFGGPAIWAKPARQGVSEFNAATSASPGTTRPGLDSMAEVSERALKGAKKREPDAEQRAGSAGLIASERGSGETV